MSALGGCEWSTLRHRDFTPGKEPRYPLNLTGYRNTSISNIHRTEKQQSNFVRQRYCFCSVWTK